MPSYGVKDASGRVQQEGKVGSTRRELGCWIRTLPQPWTVAMEATIFSDWIYDRLLPYAAPVPGVGPITAVTWALEIGDVSRFRTIKQAISYCSLCPM